MVRVYTRYANTSLELHEKRQGFCFSREIYTGPPTWVMLICFVPVAAGRRGATKGGEGGEGRPWIAFEKLVIVLALRKYETREHQHHAYIMTKKLVLFVACVYTFSCRKNAHKPRAYDAIFFVVKNQSD